MSDTPFYPRWESDLYRKPFTPRTVPLPVPVAGVFDSPYVVWPINREWLGHVVGALELLIQPDSWTGSDSQIFNAIQEAQRLMSASLSIVDSTKLKFRSKPGDLNYTLQVSFDGGANYVDTLYNLTGYGSPFIAKNPALNANVITAASGSGLIISAPNTAGSRGLSVISGGTTLARNAGSTAPGNAILHIESGDLTAPYLTTYNDSTLRLGTLINERGELAANFGYSFLPSANAGTVHTLYILERAAANSNEQNGMYYCTQETVNGPYVWKNVDSTGQRGPRGFGVKYDPFTVTILGPNGVAAWVPGDPTLDGSDYTFPVEIKLPRPPKIASAVAYRSAPGSEPTVTLIPRVDGDIEASFTIPDGEPGASGTFEIDDIPPSIGQTKTYRLLVDADSGAIAPFYIPKDAKLKSISAKGLWENIAGGTSNTSTLEGLGQPGSGIRQGRLVFGERALNASQWTYHDYSTEPFIFNADGVLKFAQNRNNIGDYGAGYLQVEFSIERGVPVIAINRAPYSPQGYPAFESGPDGCNSGDTVSFTNIYSLNTSDHPFHIWFDKLVNVEIVSSNKDPSCGTFKWYYIDPSGTLIQNPAAYSIEFPTSGTLTNVKGIGGSSCLGGYTLELKITAV